MIEQNRALLDNPEEEDDDGDPPMRSQVRAAQQDFYVKFRGVMSINAGSIGIEVMDDVAEAVTDRKAGPVDSLSDAILILPLPSRQCDNKQQPTHPWFAPSQDQQVKAKEPSSSESEGEWAEETESKCHVKPSSDEDSEEENSPPKKPKSKRSTSSENLKAESSSSSKRVKAERPPSPSRVKSEGAPPSVLAKEACFAAFFR
ncbi:hypothetical protein PI126_g20961 [Phytophthora idaei]|nr:hypothetical protein PI126_g20961 [Phytophthora idaei]